jgi:hypothetical protein
MLSESIFLTAKQLLQKPWVRTRSLVFHGQYSKPMLKILSISGSLRQVSSNTVLLKAAIALCPPNIEIKCPQDSIQSSEHGYKRFNLYLQGNKM